MRVQLSEGEKVRVMGRTKSVEAWERWVRADELINRMIRADNMEARRLLEESVQIDPSYPAAWTELGWSHIHDVLLGWTSSRESSLAEAEDMGRKSLELEPDFPTALALIGWVHVLRAEYDQAVETFEKAAALVPRDSEIIADFAYILACAGQTDEAIEMAKRAIQLCPIAPMWYLITLGMGYHLKNEHATAIGVFREAIEKEPESSLARVWLISALVESGLLDEARRTARDVARIERGFSLASWQGAPLKDAETKRHIIRNLIEAGLKQ